VERTGTVVGEAVVVREPETKIAEDFSVYFGKYTWQEELFCSLTHGVGAVFSIIGLTALVAVATMTGDPWRMVSVSVFGITLFLCYAASTLYHMWTHPRLKYQFQIFDHCAIYLLIAGTYTPFLLINMRGPWGWSMFGVLWGFAVAGCFWKFFFTGRYMMVSSMLYVAMGWMAVIAIKPAMETIPADVLSWLVAGGVAYTLGVPFYLWERLPHNHGIWHLFVMAGSAMHFIAVLKVIAPGWI